MSATTDVSEAECEECEFDVSFRCDACDFDFCGAHAQAHTVEDCDANRAALALARAATPGKEG